MKTKRKTTAKAKSAKSKKKSKKQSAMTFSSRNKTARKKTGPKAKKASARKAKRPSQKVSAAKKAGVRKSAKTPKKQSKKISAATKRASQAARSTLKNADRTVVPSVAQVASSSRKRENPAKGPRLKDPKQPESVSNQEPVIDPSGPAARIPAPEVVTEGVAPHQSTPYPTDGYVSKHALNEKAAIAKGLRKPRGTSTHTFASPGHARDSSGNK